MILFDLICSQGHGFEAWFRDSESFDRLVSVGEIQCAVCGDTDVKKALMAPRVRSSKVVDAVSERERVEAHAAIVDKGDDDKVSDGAADTAGAGGGAEAAGKKPAVTTPSEISIQDNPGPLSRTAAVPVPEKVAEAMRVLREVQTHIEKTFDHVGDRFAEEARKMHYGEAEKRSIYGEATKAEAEELADEGIEVEQMPWLTSRDS